MDANTDMNAKIDRMLLAFSDSGIFTIDLMEGLPPEYPTEILGAMQTLKLAVPKDFAHIDFVSYRLTEHGFKIKLSGGWVEYLKKESEKEKLIVEQAKSTIAANDLSEKAIVGLKEANTLQKWILGVTAFMSAAGLLVSILQYNKPNDTFILPQAVSPIDTLKLNLKEQNVKRAVFQKAKVCVCPDDSIKK